MDIEIGLAGQFHDPFGPALGGTVQDRRVPAQPDLRAVIQHHGRHVVGDIRECGIFPKVIRVRPKVAVGAGSDDERGGHGSGCEPGRVAHR